jgi:isopentenyl-diphosphate delta-isomerase
MDQVLLVDEFDQPIGLADKLAAHQGEGQLHRAFSVFLFNPDGGLLLQQRAASKYHFGGLWTNACCGHPQEGNVALHARRRLHEELGFSTDLDDLFSFRYQATDPISGLTESEYDHVLTGKYVGEIRPNPDEVDDTRWVSYEDLQSELRDAPERFTPWFKIAVDRVVSAYREMHA